MPLRLGGPEPGLAWAGLRSGPRPWLLLALGLALAACLPVLAAGLRTEATVTAVRAAVDALPPAQRSVLAVSGHDLRGPALDHVDASVRQGFAAAGLTGVQQSLTFRPLSLGGANVSVGALTELSSAVRLTSGRLPGPCRPRRCEVLAVLDPGSGAARLPAIRRSATALGLAVTGTAQLGDRRLVGTGLVPPGAPLLLGSRPGDLAGLTSLELFGRNTAWFAGLDGRDLARRGVPAVTRTLAGLADTVNLTGGTLSVAWPVDQVTAAAERARASAEQLRVLGAGAGALQLGFCVVVAAGLRRRQQLTARQLLRRGASTGQVLLATGVAPLLAVLAGSLAGAGAATVVVGVRLRSVVASPAVTAGHALASSWLTLAVLATAAVLLSVAVSRWPAGLAGSTQLVLDVVLLALVVSVVLLAAAVPGPLTAAVVVLVCAATGLLAARLWRPLVGLVAARSGLGPGARVALVSARRRALPVLVTTGFLAAACCSLVFAGAYRGSLLQSAADQAAARVPLDVQVAPSSSVSAPLSVLDGDRLRAVAPGVVLRPVVSAPVTAFAGSSRVKALPLTGLDPSALTELHEFAAVTGSTLAPAELAARLSVPPPAEGPAPVLPAGTRRLTVDAAGATADIAVSVWVGTADGRQLRIPLTGSGSRLSADLVQALPLTSRRQALTVAAVEIGESAAHLMHRQHGVGEGSTDRSLAAGVLRLGAVTVDGRPVRWPWSSWGSDGARLTRDAGSVRLTYRLTEDRLVLQPGWVARSGTPLPVAVDPDTASRAGPSGEFGVTAGGVTVPVRVVAVLPRMPTLGPSFVLADRAAVTALLDRSAPGTAVVSQVWIRAPGRGLAAVRQQLQSSPAAAASLTYRNDVAAALAADPVGTRTVTLITLAGAVALLLAVVSVATTVWTDRQDSVADHLALELDGFSTRRLRGVLAVRCLSVLAVGVPLGIAGGVVLAALAVRLLATGPDGTAVSPPLRLVLASPSAVVVLAAALLAGLAAAGLATAGAFREPQPRMPELDLR